MGIQRKRPTWDVGHDAVDSSEESGTTSLLALMTPEQVSKTEPGSLFVNFVAAVRRGGCPQRG